MTTTIEKLQILITSETSDLRRQMRQVRNELSTMDNEVRKSTDAMKSAFKGVAAAIATLGIIKYVKEGVQAASQLEGAFLGLQSIVEGQGRSFAKARGFIDSYIADGLVPLTDAVNAYKNLAARGYNDEQIQQTMERLKDAAAFGRQSSYSLGAAVASATEGLKNENSILVDNAGVTKNVAKMWDDYAASIGTTANKLTQQQKILAEVNGIMEETKFQVGDAAAYADTFAGRMSYLTKTLSDIKVNIGEAFMPILNFVIPVLQTLANWLVKVTAYFKYFMQAFFGVSKSQGSASASLSGGTTAQDDYGKAAEKAGKKTVKAAKEAKGALSGFDEINQLSMADPSGGSDAGSGADGGIDDIGFGDIDDIGFDTNMIPENVQKMVDDMKKAFNDLKAATSDLGKKFGDSFKGMGEALRPLRDAVGPIKQSFVEIGQSLSQLVNKVFKPMLDYLLFNFIPSIVTGIVRDFAPVLADAGIWGMDLASRSLKNFVDMMIGLWNDVALPSLEMLKGAFLEASASIANSLQSLLDGTIKPLAEFLINSFILPVTDTMARVFVPIFTDTLVFAIGLTAKTFENLTKTLNDLTNTIILPALQRVVDAFQNFVPSIGGSLKNLLDGTIKPFADYILNEFIIPIVSEIVQTFVPIFSDILVGAFKIAADTFKWAADFMNNIYNSVIRPTFELVKNVVMDALEIIQNTWEDHGEALITNITDLFANIIELFQSLWDNVLEPIIVPFLETLTWLWDSHLKGLIQETVNFVMKLVGAALDILNKFILPIINYLVVQLGPTFKTIFNFVVDVIATSVAYIADVIKGLLQILGGLIDFIVGVFTLNWGKAWDGVVSVFTGIVTLISNVFKGVLNLTIDIINAAVSAVIDGINRLISGAMALVNAVPGIDININPIPVPRIPKLARGGIVDGATNFGNYIAGEAGKEMVVPLENTPFVDKLASALGSAVMAAMTMSNDQQSGGSQGDIILNLDGTVLARILNPYLSKEQQRTGMAIIQPM